MERILYKKQEPQYLTQQQISQQQQQQKTRSAQQNLLLGSPHKRIQITNNKKFGPLSAGGGFFDSLSGSSNRLPLKRIKKEDFMEMKGRSRWYPFEDQNESNKDSPMVSCLFDQQQHQEQSLQASFKNFLEKKRKKILYKKMIKKNANRLRDQDPKRFKESLRTKFVQTIKSYFGVPYKKKFHEPGSKLYNSPLFLDCCGLVRKAMYDLREDFGFCIGSGNQAYMFDTLPVKVTEETAKPGDLIFFEATYYPEKRFKRQIHDIVHVEVYAGNGRSYASRYSKGVVREFDSYKFESSNYYDIKYHFRSIDTWLDGVCV